MQLSKCGRSKSKVIYTSVSSNAYHEKSSHCLLIVIFSAETKLCGFSLQVNYTDQANAACRRS
jgi:hypothetical protein